MGCAADQMSPHLQYMWLKWQFKMVIIQLLISFLDYANAIVDGLGMRLQAAMRKTQCLELDNVA